MKIYLAAAYGRNAEMRSNAAMLEHLGHEITSRWIQGNHELPDGSDATTEKSIALRQRYAEEDIEDLGAADVMIGFTGSSPRGRGGRHVEFGLALAGGMPILLVGDRENVFHWLPQVQQFDDWISCFDFIAALDCFNACLKILREAEVPA